MKNRLLVIAPLLVLVGCTSSGTKVTADRMTQFQKGVTTEADVLRTLGSPQHVVTAADGARTDMYVWAHSQIKGASFIPVVGLFAGGAKAEANTATFHFDANGKLLDYSTSESNTDVRAGGASTASSPK